MTARVTDVKEHIWSKVMPEPNSGCWLWMGHIDAGGYGWVAYHGRDQRAHRASYEAFRGPIPTGLEIDHLCRVRCCVNPDHLEPVTRSENVKRGLVPILVRQRAAAIECCPAGHSYDEENTYVCGRGWRQCRACRKDKEQLRRIAKGTPRPGEHNRSKTHCARGHPFDEENTYIRPGKYGRSCKECMRENNARFYAKRAQ